MGAASTTCGHCGRFAYMEPASDLHIVAHTAQSGAGTVTATFRCPSCKLLNVASVQHTRGLVGSQTRTLSSVEDYSWDSATWLPRYGDMRQYGDVPQHIAQAATEATLCLSVDAFRAVGSLARAVIEATAKDKGAQGGNLRARIDALQTADHIRKHTRDQAHEIRYFGNGMAHGDFVDPVTREEAEEVIELMSEVLDEVYQSPARLKRRKAARVAKTEDADEVG